MLGVLGEYLWQAFDESRRRTRYIIERFCDRPIISQTTQRLCESEAKGRRQ